MITQLKGIVGHITEQTITLDVHNIGFIVHMPHAQLIEKDKPLSVYIYMHWNAEQGPALFGFLSEFEKAVFLLIVSCSGIGPKIALTILQKIKPSEFITAVQTGNEKLLSSVPGIGAKKAEQMIVQLRHKVAKWHDLAVTDSESPQQEQLKNVCEVLESLHYSRVEVSQAMQYLHGVPESGSFTFDQLLRNALSFLSKRV